MVISFLIFLFSGLLNPVLHGIFIDISPVVGFYLLFSHLFQHIVWVLVFFTMHLLVILLVFSRLRSFTLFLAPLFFSLTCGKEIVRLPLQGLLVDVDEPLRNASLLP